MKRRRIFILGCTGSTSESALKVARDLPERMEVVGLTAGRNVTRREDPHPGRVHSLRCATSKRQTGRHGLLQPPLCPGPQRKTVAASTPGGRGSARAGRVGNLHQSASIAWLGRSLALPGALQLS